MKANLKRSAAVLGIVLFTVAPAITHAATEQQWLQTQLQFTDGYTSQAATPALKNGDGTTSRTDTKAARDADGRTGYVGADRGSALIDHFQG